MEPKNRLLWAFGTGGADQVMTFSDKGAEHLSALIALHRP